MTRKEEIAAAYKDYMSNGGMLQSNPWFAFKEGTEWADENPINVWHDASEEPQEYPIICQDEFNNVWVQNNLKDYVDGWKEFEAVECIIRWAYISDLLPKGGEE